LIIEKKTDGNLVINALIILIKLKYEKILSMLWPVNFKNFDQSKLKMFEPFDYAMEVLTDTSASSSSSSSKSNSHEFLFKFNAAEFLYEFIRYDEVKKFLEK
jgi:hypothetical protein